jgi:RNA polymerase-binding transcription factor DksA
VDEEWVAPPTEAGDGICVECGARIPREVLETLTDGFRCPECRPSSQSARRPQDTTELRQTA